MASTVLQSVSSELKTISSNTTSDNVIAVATSDRPTYLGIGSSIYDTTLNKPIWVKSNNSGSVVWVDATGTTV